MPVVMPVVMPVAMIIVTTACSHQRSLLGLKRRQRLANDQMLQAQRLGDRGVGQQQQVIGRCLDRHMLAAQLMGHAQQIGGAAVLGAVAHHQHRLRRGLHHDQRAVFGHQNVTVVQRRACIEQRMK